MDQLISDLAKAVELPEFDTKKAVEYLKHDILLSLYRKNPNKPEHMAAFNIEINQKVAAVYEAWYGHKFNPKIHSKNKRIPMFLMGPPGQGKTASYHAAAAEVCEAMGLNLIDNVTDDYIPELNDFVFVTQEAAGENSALTYGGLPRAVEVTINGVTETVLKKAINYRFAVFKHCAGGVLLFDDAANAASVIQNVLLPVAQNNTFQGLHIPNACIGFTGNLGALDGTKTSEPSSALLTRVFSVFITDTPKNFCERVLATYNDPLGDLGYSNFILRCKLSEFSGLPQNGKLSGFPCSRAHENTIQLIRAAVERNGGRGVGEERSLMQIAEIAKAELGVEVGSKVQAYFFSYMRGADPLAKQYVLEGKPNKAMFDDKYSGGSSQADMAFGFQFATACGDYAVNFITDSKLPKEEALQEGMKRFGRAILLLNDSEFGYALEYLKTKMASVISDFSTPTKDKDKRELRNDIRESIAYTINDLEDCSASHREILIKVITDFDKMQTSNMFGNKKAGGRKIQA